MGMQVYLLHRHARRLARRWRTYLERTVGGLDVDDPALWSVYQAGLAELFESMPFVDGLMVRIGEGGAVYQRRAGTTRRGSRSPPPSAVQAMLTALLETAAAHDREIIFRTWTVGVGAVGDLHTNPESYETVLGGIDDPHLIVSTKYTLGDFYSHLPLNPTLETGSHRAHRRVPGAPRVRGLRRAAQRPGAPTRRRRCSSFLAANPHVEGIWNWTQDGGPLRARAR